MENVTKKTVSPKKKKTRSYYIRVIVIFLIMGGFVCTLISQQIRLINIRRETAQCKEVIAVKEKEYKTLEEKAKYNSSDDFYERKARDEGYVREDETVFVVGN